MRQRERREAHEPTGCSGPPAGAGGRLCLRRRDRPPTGPEPRRRLEGGGGPAAGRLHRGGPDGTGIPAGGRSRRHDGAGDPPLPGADGRGGPEAHMPGVGGLHQSLCQAAGHGRCGGRHRGDGGPPDGGPGPPGPGLPVPRRTGHLPHRPAAAGPAAGEALPTDGHGRRGGVPGGGAGVRAEPRPEVAQRPGAGRPEALRHPDGAVPGGGDGPGGPCGPGHRRQCAPAAGGLRPGGPGDGHVPGPGAGQARVPARPGGGAHPGDGPALRRPAERSAGAVSGGVPPAVREPGKDRASALPRRSSGGDRGGPGYRRGLRPGGAHRGRTCADGPVRRGVGPGMYGYTE